MQQEARKYRKRPVVISAYQAEGPGEIETLEGVMRFEAGDWIITGIKGEMYPCKPDIFAATYEPVDEPPAPEPFVPEWRTARRTPDWMRSGRHG